MHGPPATQPEQQNGRPTWKTALPPISISQETQVNGYSVLKRRMGDLVVRRRSATDARPSHGRVHRSYPRHLKHFGNADEESVNATRCQPHIHVLFMRIHGFVRLLT